MSDIWAPWQPKAGDRVRVRVSLECLYCLDPRFRQCYENALADDGRTGTVYDVGHDGCGCRYDIPDDPPSAAHMAHSVWVKFDDQRPYDDMGDFPFDAHFAIAELEPLT